MAQFHTNELEYMVDDMADFDGNPFDDGQSPRNTLDDSPDSDIEDDYDQKSNPKTDTSAAEARNGKDIQGIPWERLTFTRDEYRQTRLKQYKNFESLSRSRENLEKECKPVQKGSKMYDFQFNTRLVKSTIVHFQPLKKGGTYLSGKRDKKDSPFICSSKKISIEKSAYNMMLRGPRAYQLRNLLCTTSKNDVYLMQNYSLMHWSPLLRRGKEVLSVARPISPTLKYPGSSSHTLSRVQISTMAVKDNLMVAGGFHGELICKYLDQPGVAFCTKVATGENAITNAVDIYRSSGGSVRVLAANNDAQVRVFDGGNFACLSRFMFPWSVNNISVSPDGKSFAVLGDSTECLIADAQSGKVHSKLKGHLDYSFASAWHPDGRVLATGNQDTTCRLWDVRNLSESLAVLKGRMGAIRAIRFTSDGRFMAMAEPADFVHIFDTRSDYGMGQEIDLFGEIAGISFSPGAEALFVGIADRTYGSLLEFNRRHHSSYVDSMF